MTDSKSKRDVRGEIEYETHNKWWLPYFKRIFQSTQQSPNNMLGFSNHPMKSI